MTTSIDTKAKRDRLAKRREPYWQKLILGGYIGYRVGAIGGSWIARYRDEAGKQRYKASDLPAHLAVNEFDCAAGEAGLRMAVSLKVIIIFSMREFNFAIALNV